MPPMNQFPEELLVDGMTYIPIMVLDHFRAVGMTSHEFDVYVAIMNYRIEDEALPSPTIAYVAVETQYSERTVQRHIRHLQSKGLLIVSSNPGEGNTYDFTPFHASIIARYKKQLEMGKNI